MNAHKTCVNNFQRNTHALIQKELVRIYLVINEISYVMLLSSLKKIYVFKINSGSAEQQCSEYAIMYIYIRLPKR